MNHPDPRPLRKRIDDYMLTQGYSFFRNGQADEQVIFELFVRKLPELSEPTRAGEMPGGRTFLVNAGLAQALRYLDGVRFTALDAHRLRDEGFPEDYIQFLLGWKFRGNVRAIREGEVVTAGVPVIQVRGSRFDCQMVESGLIGAISPATAIATKAARIVVASRGRPCWDFSLRRLHDPIQALTVARSSFIAGFAGTASWEESYDLGIPTTGTMAHQYIMRWPESGEQEAFEQFLHDLPDRAALLVDTYDTARGVDRAIKASLSTGVPLKAVRLDSGDLIELSKMARTKLDAAGMHDTDVVYKQGVGLIRVGSDRAQTKLETSNAQRRTKVMATNDLDEYEISHILAHGGEIDIFGVGTRLGAVSDKPTLGTVYKIVVDRGEGRMKKAEGKQTDPGEHTVWRTAEGQLVVALAGELAPIGAEMLMHDVMHDGNVLPGVLESLPAIQARFQRSLEKLDPAVRSGQRQLMIERSAGLVDLIERVSTQAANDESVAPASSHDQLVQAAAHMYELQPAEAYELVMYLQLDPAERENHQLSERPQLLIDAYQMGNQARS